jgi:hypothetical protein
MNVNNNNVLRQRTYSVNHHVRFGCGFVPIVKHPSQSRDGKPRVRWQHFHDVQRAQGMEAFPVSRGITSYEGGTMMTMSQAPESHANIRAHQSIIDSNNPGTATASALSSAAPSQNIAALLSNMSSANPNYGADLERNDFTVLPMDLQRYAANVGGDASQVTGSPTDAPGMLFPEVMLGYSDDFLDASTSLPHAAALHPTLPGPDRFRVTDAAEDANDYTANAADLSRYSAAIGQGDSLPKGQGVTRFTPLPTQFNKDKGGGGGGSSGGATSPTVIVAPTPTVDQLGRRTSSSIDINPATTSQATPAAAAAGGAKGLERSKSPKVTIALPTGGGDGDEENPTNEEEEERDLTSGPLYGVHPIERSTSYAKDSGAGGGGEDEEGAGPMHFASSKARQGAKSFKEISSLFTGGDDENQDEELGAASGSGSASKPPLN